MNTRATKRCFTNNDEPPPPAKRRGTGRPASAADPRPKRTAIKGGVGARKPRKRVEGRMGIKGGFGNRPVLPGPQGGGFTTTGMGAASATGPIPFLPLTTQPAASLFPTGTPVIQPPTSTPAPAAPNKEPQGPFIQAYYPEARFVGPRPIQAAATRFQGQAPYKMAAGIGGRLKSLQEWEEYRGQGTFEGVGDEDRASMKCEYSVSWSKMSSFGRSSS